MSLTIDMYMLVGRDWLKNHYTKSFEEFNSCCGVCWCLVRRKSIQDEFEKKKGFEIFNSRIICWKVYEFLNSFEIFPCVETIDS